MKKLVFFVLALTSLGALQAYPNLYVEADFIYAQAIQSDLDFAIHPQVTFVGDSVVANAPHEGLTFHWDPGVRATIGTDFNCNWGLDLVGTFLHNHARGDAAGDVLSDTNILAPIWFQSFTGNRANSASGRWTLDFGTLDLVARRSFAFCDVNFIPRFGLRGAYIRQRYDIHYDTIAFPTAGAPLLFPAADVRMRSQFRGIGFLGGMDLSMPLCSGLSIDGAIAGSVLYGKATVRENVNGAFPFPGAPLIPATLSLPDTSYGVRANIDTEAGFSYNTCVCSLPVHFYAGYFFSVWFDQNDFYNLFFSGANVSDPSLAVGFITDDQKDGNLQLQGVVLGLGVQF
jgi:hypothetical protein